MCDMESNRKNFKNTCYGESWWIIWPNYNHQPRCFCWNNEISWNLSYLLEENRSCEVAILFDQNRIAGINRKKHIKLPMQSWYYLQSFGHFCNEFWPQIRTSQIHNCLMVLCRCWHPAQFGQVWNWNETNLYWSIPANHWEIISLSFTQYNCQWI